MDSIIHADDIQHSDIKHRSPSRQPGIDREIVSPLFTGKTNFALPYEGGRRPDWCRYLELLLKERQKALGTGPPTTD